MVSPGASERYGVGREEGGGGKERFSHFSDAEMHSWNSVKRRLISQALRAPSLPGKLRVPFFISRPTVKVGPAPERIMQRTSGECERVLNTWAYSNHMLYYI